MNKPHAKVHALTSIKNLLACMLMLLLLAVVHWQNPTWIGANTHPYLLLAIVLSGISGVRGSILSVLTIVTIYSLWFVDVSGINTYLSSLDGIGFSLGVLFSALFIGFITDLVRKENRELTDHLSSLKKTLAEVEVESTALNQETQDLVSKIAMENVPLTELIKFSQQMSSEDLPEICHAMVSFLSKRIGSNSSYVYLTNEHELQRIAFIDDDAHVLPVHISLQNVTEFPAIANALATKKCTTLVELSNSRRDTPQKEGVLIATPIIDSDDHVLGILAIRRLKFMQFLASNCTLIQTVGEYGGASIEKLNRLNQLRDRNFYNEELGVFNDRYFRIRSDQERIRSLRYQQPLAVIHINYTSTTMISHAKRSLVVKCIIKILNDFRRAEDVLAMGADGTRFQLLMPMATEEFLSSIKLSIAEQFKNVMAKTGLHTVVDIHLDSQWITPGLVDGRNKKVA